MNLRLIILVEKRGYTYAPKDVPPIKTRICPCVSVDGKSSTIKLGSVKVSMFKPDTNLA
jgi:hypothetical protein